MPQKIRIPQAIFREQIGKENNKRNDKSKLGDDQRVLNTISNMAGKTLTPAGITYPFGWWYSFITLCNVVPPVDFPDQQMVVKKTPPAFEVNTWIDVRKEGNQTRIHSFVSTSTINNVQIYSPLFLNTAHTISHPSTSIASSFISASPLFGNQSFFHKTPSSTQEVIDVAKIAHELTLTVHQKVHDLSELVSCNTTRRTDQVNAWIVTGESVEQTSFTTVCQGAVGRAEAQNNQRMKQESENSTLSSIYLNNTTGHRFQHFSAEEIARKLSENIRSNFENKHNATTVPKSNIHNQMTETFWNGLAERFCRFFYPYENTSYAQEHRRLNEVGIMAQFVDFLLQIFSIDYGGKVSVNYQSEKNLQSLMRTHPTKSLSLFKTSQKKSKKAKQENNHQKLASKIILETVTEGPLVLPPEEENTLTYLIHLAEEFCESMDGFLQQWVGLQFLGAEAMPIHVGAETTISDSPSNATSTPIVVFGSNVTQAEEIDNTQEINEKIQAFLRENAVDPTKTVAKEIKKELSPLEWTSEQKENIRKKLVDFFMENGIVCQESNDRELMETVGEWGLLEGATPPTLDMVKVKQIAKIILEMGEEAVISEEQAGLTVGSWIYETMKDNQPVALALVAEAPEQTTEMNTTRSTSTPQPTSVDKQKNNIVETDGIQWRDPNVRKQVEAFFQQKKLLSDQPTKEELLVTMGKRITKEENNQLIFDYEKLQPVAKVILKALKFNDEKNEEKISNKDAELTVMKWAFETILGSSIEAYMVKNLVSVPDVDQFTMGRLRDLFTVRNLEKEGLIQLDVPTLSQKQKRRFNKLWNFLLQQELPNYFLDSSGLADHLLISDYASLMQLTGAKILKEGGYLQSFNPEDSRLMGQHFWKMILEKGITTYEEFRHLLLPSLLAVAQLEPDLLREALATGTYKEVAISTFIGYQQEGYYKIVDNQELLDRLYKAYQEAFLQWRRKEALATNVAEKCRSKGSHAPLYIMKQNYLLGLEGPCRDIDWFPPKLEDEYIKLTKNVSEAHFPFDKKLMEFALNAVDKKERAFIFSKTTILYEGFAELKNETHYTGGAPGTGGMLLINFRGRVTWEDTTLSLDKTDLFVAVNGKEERWYALKRLDEEGGYILYRVDQDPLSYLKYGLFNRKDLWEKGYRQVGNKIRIGDKYFQFSARVNRSKKLSHGVEMESLIETLSRKHSDQLYDQLYDSGNDKADIEKAWDTIKHFIPFYDCVTGIIDQDTGEAVVSCTIDALLMIPVLGQITSLNMKFALGVARAFARGGIRNVIRSSKSFLPTAAETRRLVLAFAQTLDPGFETLIGGGRLIVRNLVKYKNELREGKKIKDLLERVETLDKAQEGWEKSIEMVEWNGLEVPVRKVNEHLYMRVTNLGTAEVFGGLFMKKGNRIEVYRPATFTNEQLKLINFLEVKLDKNQIFIVEVNPNPQAYGTGEITTVAKEGEETKRFIQMKGKLIEVTMTAIKEHGIRLDVYAHHSAKILPVNFNGMEWYFEAPTSPFVAKEVEKEIASMLDQFETQQNPSGLSAPDGKGMMWDTSGRSYIKISDHYIPLIALGKNENRYYLMKKDYNELKTVLSFDAKNGKFRFETGLEKMKVTETETKVSYQRGKPKGESDLNEGQSRVSQGESPGTSGTSKETKNTSQEIGSQTNGSGKVLASETFDRFKFGKQTGDVWNDIPPSKEKWDLWNKLRGAEVYKKPPSIRVEDSTVELPPLSKFVSELTPTFYPNDHEIRTAIVAQIKERLPIDFNFRTFAGVKVNKMPDFLKSFVEDLEENLVQALDYLDTGIAIFKNLSSKAILSETKEGQYLTKLFSLEGLDNQEEILKETIKRFLSISEKVKNFLKQSKLWDYENILIVSGDLIHQEVGSEKYLSQSNKLLPWGLVVPGDAECRIIIFADAFHIDPKLIPSSELTQSAYITFIHEITHLVSNTHDIVTYPLPDKGFRISVKQQREIINDNFTTILYSEPFDDFVKQLAKELNLPTLSKEVVREAMYNDRLLLVNFLLTDAEFTTIILRDLIEGRAYDEIIRVTRSTDNLNLERKFMFLFFAMAFIYDYQSFERTLHLNNEKEKKTTKTMDNVSTEIPRKEVTTNIESIKRTETSETTKDTVSKGLLDLITNGIISSNSTTKFVIKKQEFTEPTQSKLKRSDLDLATNPQKNSNMTRTDIKEQGVTKPTQFTSGQIFSNLVSMSIKESNKLRQNKSDSRIHNRQELTPQY